MVCLYRNTNLLFNLEVSTYSTTDACLDPNRCLVAYIGIQFKPRTTIGITQNILVEIGGSATLYCISSHPNSTYVWKRDGIQVASHSSYSFLINGVLQIRDIMQTDGGLYICSATAVYPKFGQQTRKTMINLTVYSESIMKRMLYMYYRSAFPFVYLGLPSVNLTLTQSANVSTISIVCDCDGSAPLLVQILHNAVILFQQNVTDDQRSVGTHNVSILSSGIYQCIASNPYGSKQTSLFVRLQSTLHPFS